MSLSFNEFITSEYSDISDISSEALDSFDSNDYDTNDDENVVTNINRDVEQEIQTLEFCDLDQFYIDMDVDIIEDANGSYLQDSEALYLCEFPIFDNINRDMNGEVEILVYDDFVIEFAIDDFLL